MEYSFGLPVNPNASTEQANRADRITVLRETAKAFEASFLAEMLKNTGLGKSRESFGGGAGEDAFGSLLITEQASLMAESGGIGLAEHIFNSLAAREGLT